MGRMVLSILLVMIPGSVIGQNLRLNELASWNVSSVVDDYGDFEDWIEIYNGSRQDIDLGGWFISDDRANPGKWRIPGSEPRTTLIPAGAYLILWADREPDQGPLHLDLKLSKTGEEIYLSREDETGLHIMDSVSYPEFTKDLSYGFCNGSKPDWKILSKPTPGLPNICPYNKGERKKEKKSRL